MRAWMRMTNGREEGGPLPGLAELVVLSAELSTGDGASWRAALEAARRTCDGTAIDETLLQSYLFVGFPVVLNAFTVWREMAGAPRACADGDLESRREAGVALCRRIYGRAYERLRDHVAGLHPDLDRWMLEEGYGKTLSRPGLGSVERELCVVSLLAAAGHLPQLRSHLRGALNVGAGVGAVDAALQAGLEVGCRNRGAPRQSDDDARNAWSDIRQRVERECSSTTPESA